MSRAETSRTSITNIKISFRIFLFSEKPIRTHTYLTGDPIAHEVLEEVLVVMGEQVLDHVQDVHGRIGKELEPVLTPVVFKQIQTRA